MHRRAGVMLAAVLTVTTVLPSSRISAYEETETYLPETGILTDQDYDQAVFEEGSDTVSASGVDNAAGPDGFIIEEQETALSDILTDGFMTDPEDSLSGENGDVFADYSDIYSFEDGDTADAAVYPDALDDTDDTAPADVME